MPTVARIAVSDRCFGGERADEGGPRAVHLLAEQGDAVVPIALGPGNRREIEKALCCVRDRLDVVLAVTIRLFRTRRDAGGGLGRVRAGGVGRSGGDVPQLPVRHAADHALARGRGYPRPHAAAESAGQHRAAEEALMAVAPALAHGLVMLHRRRAGSR